MKLSKLASALLAAAAVPLLALAPAQASTGSGWYWGNPAKGGPASGWTTMQPVPGGYTFTKINAENTYTDAIMPDGSVVAWGDGTDGDLGDGASANSPTPVTIPGLSNVTALAGGNSFGVALESDGTLMAWGNNTGGMIGQGTTTGTYRTPVAVPLPYPVCAVDAGGFHVVAVTCNGAVYAWGKGTDGQLGTGNTRTQPSPVQVNGFNGETIVAVSTGNEYSTVTASDGTVYGFGDNQFGQLCLGDTVNQKSPALIPSLTSDTVAAGGNILQNGHLVALTSTGNVVACGYGANGQLGDGSWASSDTPVTVTTSAGTPLSDVAQVSAGGAFSLAVTADGTLYAWGDYTYGELANGATTSSNVPVQVATNMTDPSGGSMHGAALSAS